MLKTSTVSFPGLGIDSFDLDSVAFIIFGKEVAWYGVVITLGIIFCFIYVMWRSKVIGLIPDDVIDIGIVAVILGIIGGRTYYVLTTLSEVNYDSFIKVIAIWEGGMAIYGALIGGGIGVYVMCKIKKVNFSAFADCTCPAILFAQVVGRLGNFFNGEAFGAATDIFCRMGIQNNNSFFTFGTTEMVYVHPTFLYELIWNLIGFAIALMIFKKRKYNGMVFHFCFAWYGFGRMFIELLRTDSLYLIPELYVWYNKISVLVGFGCFVGFTALMMLQLYRLKNGSDDVKQKLNPISVSAEEYAYIVETRMNKEKKK